MIYHIVNGDELSQKLQATRPEGEIIVCRECMSDGPLQGEDLNSFFVSRGGFLLKEYNLPLENYLENSVREFYKIVNIPAGSEVNLWFEDDLFCLSNMLFVISLLSHKSDSVKINRVFPVTVEKDHWKGFGIADEEALVVAYSLRTQFHKHDVQLAIALWIAFRNSDLVMLDELSNEKSHCFRYLKEVVTAHIERFPLQGEGRPRKVIREIVASGKSEFNEVYSEFYKREGLYGFSDLQIRKIFNEFMASG
jgi:hypothetical protein